MQHNIQAELGRLSELVAYTEENSKYPIKLDVFFELWNVKANQEPILAWCRGTDTPRSLLKQLDAIARENNDDLTFAHVGRALTRKPTDFNSPESVNKAKAKRLKTLRKKLGDEKIEQLKQFSKYNRNQIEDWLNFEGEIWSQERYTIGYFLDILHFAAKENCDFNTVKLLNQYLPFLHYSIELGNSQKREIKVKTDVLRQSELAARKQEILALGFTEQELQNLIEIDNQINPTHPIETWIAGKGRHQNDSARKMFTDQLLELLHRQDSSRNNLSLDWFNIIIAKKLYLSAPQDLTVYLEQALRVSSPHNSHYVKTFVELGASCSLESAVNVYYLVPGALEVILEKGKFVDLQAAIKKAEELAKKYKRETHYNFQKPLALLREYLKQQPAEEVVIPLHQPIAIQQLEIDTGSPMVEVRREYAPELKAILDRLIEYRNRIDREGVSHFRICLFKKSRTANRQINYNIANGLISSIEKAATNVPLQQTISNIFNHLFYSPTGIYMETFNGEEIHTIRSSELNRIIKDALEISNNPVVRCGI